jgi:membrane protein implicated in regulation of membrane protease activity
MTYDRHRATNRRAIGTALLIWLIAQGVVYLEPLGVPPQTAGVLTVAGLVVLPALLVWPWVRHFFRPADDEVPLERGSTDFRNRTVISGEIVLLSAALILMLLLMPR